MNEFVAPLSPLNIGLALLPIVVLVGILYRWKLKPWELVYATSRMITQLLLVGYFLAYLFGADNISLMIVIILIMITASSWISLHTIRPYRLRLLPHAFLSVSIVGLLILFLILIAVLSITPWYQASYIVPIGGMIFAASMNSISLAADRIVSELKSNSDYNTARNCAFQASIIPSINSLFAVGLVTLPGMMTGQILAGVPPLIASQYQIVVMCMIMAAAGISSAIFLVISKDTFLTIKKT